MKPAFLKLALAVLLSVSGTWSGAEPSKSPANDAFVRVRDGQFIRRNQPYRFIGANFWQAMNLGSPGKGGDRARLIRELDRLKAIGVRNLRLIAMSEGPGTEPYRVLPAVQNTPGVFDEALLQGLDFALAEMAKRDLTAVLCLGNFWPWSGGFAQYVSWAERSPIPYPPPHPGGSWSVFQDYSSRFYTLPEARSRYESAVRKLLTRINTVTKQPYSADPTILSWELANEPRGGKHRKEFLAWVDSMSGLIHALDPNHLVTTGSEGDTSDPAGAGNDFIADHSPRGIDYATIHLWVENWGFYDPRQAGATFNRGTELIRTSLRSHVERAVRMKKPLVLEEFGLARDGRSMDPGSPTRMRDRFLDFTFTEAKKLDKEFGALPGAAFWAWSGESRPVIPGGLWKTGHPLLGDPPHEEQGWYGVYDRDLSTLQVIRKHATLFFKN
jgi:mannan endo-1,4-beta-mannosidase